MFYHVEMVFSDENCRFTEIGYCYSSFKMDIVDCDFPTTICKCLKEGEIEHVYSIFQETSYLDVIQNNSWEVISIVCQYINAETKKKNFKLFECCANIIDIIASKLTPDDVILQFVEEIEKAEDDETFCTLLHPIAKVILRIPNKRQNSLAWCFNAIESFLNKLDVPQSFELEKLILMDANVKVARITHLLNDELLPFYELFVCELVKQQGESEFEERRLIVLKFLIQLLGKPFAYLDMEEHGSSKSRIRHIAERICQNIFKLLEDPILLVDIYVEDERNVVCKPNYLSQGVLFYLIFGEQIILEHIPKVYSHVYIFQSYLHLIPILLDNSQQLLVSKGLKLTQAFLRNLKDFELDYQLLDLDSHSKFCKQLSIVIIYNSLEENRKLALQLLKEYFNKFETRGRYLLVYNLVQVVNHAGLIGFIISYYKDMINDELNFNKCTICKYLCGPELFKVLRRFCHLHKAEESDLIELADQIIASLNLLRYLAIRDKKNVTKIWDYFSSLKHTYFEPLKKGLMLSKAHYELKVQELKTSSSAADRKQNLSNVSVVVGGEELAAMPTSQKIVVLRSALTAFDVMESVLGRLTELIESGPSM